MGVSKSSFFTEEQNELASKLKALAHPARIAIVQYILKQKKMYLYKYCGGASFSSANYFTAFKRVEILGYN